MRALRLTKTECGTGTVRVHVASPSRPAISGIARLDLLDAATNRAPTRRPSAIEDAGATDRFPARGEQATSIGGVQAIGGGLSIFA